MSIARVTLGRTSTTFGWGLSSQVHHFSTLTLTGVVVEFLESIVSTAPHLGTLTLARVGIQDLSLTTSSGSISWTPTRALVWVEYLVARATAVLAHASTDRFVKHFIPGAFVGSPWRALRWLDLDAATNVQVQLVTVRAVKVLGLTYGRINNVLFSISSLDKLLEVKK